MGFVELRDLIIKLRLSARSCGLSSYLPMHIDHDFMFESTVQPRYNEGPNDWQICSLYRGFVDRGSFSYISGRSEAPWGASPLLISSRAKRVYRAWC